MLKAEESQRKLNQHLSEGYNGNDLFKGTLLNDNDSDDTDVNTSELSDGEYLDDTIGSGEDGRFVTTLLFSNIFASKVMQLDEILKEGERKGKVRESENSDGEDQHTDWCNNARGDELLAENNETDKNEGEDADSSKNFSEGELLIVGDSVAEESEGEQTDAEDCHSDISEGEICDETVNDESSPCVAEDNISDEEITNEVSEGYLSCGEIPFAISEGNLSDGEIAYAISNGDLRDGEIPNAISEGYLSCGEIPYANSEGNLSDGELYMACDNESKYLRNTDEGKRCRNEDEEEETLKNINDLRLVNSKMFDEITKVNRWLFPEVVDMDVTQEISDTNNDPASTTEHNTTDLIKDELSECMSMASYHELPEN